MTMEITCLGSASAFPTTKRATTAYALRINFPDENELLLIDAGEGTQTQLMKSTCKFSKINRILITHLHGDHIFGLPGLLCTISMNMQVFNDDKCIDIYGPLGIKKFVRNTLRLSFSDLNYNIRIHEMIPCSEQLLGVEELISDHETLNKDLQILSKELKGTVIQHDENMIWNLFQTKYFTAKASWCKHRVPSFGFVFKAYDRPGKLDTEKLKHLGIEPGPIFQEIKQGKIITLDNGKQLIPGECTLNTKKGQKVTIMGDTSASLESMKLICMDSDFIAHEATLENSLEEKALSNGHSTPAMAGLFAKECNAKMLVISHFSQRYKPRTESGEITEDVKKMLQQAKYSFSNENVFAAEDLMKFEV